MKHNWKYLLDLDRAYALPWLPPHIRLDLEWISIAESVLTVRAGYAWDGCSPTGLWWDTWDGPMDPATMLPLTYWASLLHDATYQYIWEIVEATGIPVRRVRQHADDDFLRELKAAGFEYARLYYRAVRMFGWIPVLRRRRR